MSDSAVPWTGARQAPLSMGFPRQEYWNRLLFPSPEDLPDLGMEPGSPALAGRFFTTELMTIISAPLNECSCSLRRGFPDSSVGKESACNAGDPGLTPGLGRSPGGGIATQLQYSWGSLVAQLVKNPPAMREAWAYTVHAVAKSQTRLRETL